MRWRARLRKTAKWAGLAVCAMIVGAFCVTLRWRVIVTVCRDNQSAAFMRGAILWDGALGYTCGAPSPGSIEPDGLSFSLRQVPFSLIKWPLARGTLQNGLFYVPLWMLFLPFAVATGLLWLPDHIAVMRIRAGRCHKCGYDRGGIAADAKCPECGTVAAKSSSL